MYLIKNKLLLFFIKSIDLLLRFIHKNEQQEKDYFNRILLCNSAHLGDIVLATSLLPIIKNKFPDVKIGFLTGSWSTVILKEHPMVDYIHTVDHWKLNRLKMKKLKKVIHYFKTRKSALIEVKKNKYDIAIDLYSFFPNSALFLYQSKIPTRVGYTSAGFGRLYTHQYFFKEKQQHIIDYSLALLKVLNVKLSDVKREQLHPFLPQFKADRLKKNIVESKSYIVVHPGAGSQVKEWPLENWSQLLIKIISETTNNVVFTGSGEREFNNIKKIISQAKCSLTFDESRVKDSSNQLSFHQFFNVVAGANTLIGVDSVAGHIASAMEVKKIILLYTGINPSYLWLPLGKAVEICKYSVSCSPCFLSKGCHNMYCINKIQVCDVMNLLL